MLGIALGITALITVLSVMNGFQEEVRGRILAMTPHATINRWNGVVEDWRAVRDWALEDARVLGGAPYIRGEAMLNHSSLVSEMCIRDSTITLSIKAKDMAEEAEVLQDYSRRSSTGATLGDIFKEQMGDYAVARMKRCRIVVRFGAGYDNFDLAALGACLLYTSRCV